ncbi:short-chain dehydrogenase, partial [Vibrio parahaemolyticus]|uniref:SDR family NAD(P)-dependent oxidoreductase n=1 Tax=Vibrio parahaemolyticus TaxID=670 RepID=UPI000937484E
VEGLFEQLDSIPSTVVHSAGSGYFGPLEKQDPDQIQTLIENNLSSAINVLRELVKRYKDQPVNVVMIMSTAAQQPKAQESTYCAVKWAVKGLIESVRLELKGKPMKIIAVYPGGMATEFWETSGKSLDTSSFMSAEDAALMILGALANIGNGYVSDITVNRL